MPALSKTILVVDDDPDIRELIGFNLLQAGFRVETAENGAAGIKKAIRLLPDLILLDVMMPEMDGIEACKQLREHPKTKGCLIAFLSARGEDYSQIAGFDSGADDYITKPFRFGELLARMRAHLRQHEKSETAALNIGPYIFQPAVKLLTREDDGARIRLTEKETNILKFLFRQSSQTVSREVLLHEVWGYNAGVTTHTLETHIYRLRQKIESNPSEAQILLTDEGGYRLMK